MRPHILENPWLGPICDNCHIDSNHVCSTNIHSFHIRSWQIYSSSICFSHIHYSHIQSYHICSSHNSSSHRYLRQTISSQVHPTPFIGCIFLIGKVEHNTLYGNTVPYAHFRCVHTEPCPIKDWICQGQVHSQLINNVIGLGILYISSFELYLDTQE